MTGDTAKEVGILGPNSYFGELSLLTEEPRSATITVTSETAKCLRLKKNRFEELVAKSNKIYVRTRAIIAQNILDSAALFKNMPASQKAKVLEALVPVTFNSSTYICRQGTPGNTFYIITDGVCRVTKNMEHKVSE